jgi:hypothetical protein
MLFFLSSLLVIGVANAATLPSQVLGFYSLIADDTVQGYTSTDNWQPNLYDYQLNGTNVLWLTFINPNLMPAVPVAMANLAKCKGQKGCPPKNMPVIFSVGGEAYSNGKWSTWPWLASQATAEAMAEKVATWDTQYGADGIDLDIEGNAGASKAGGGNLVYFAKKLHQLNPGFLITQPVYGFPQIDAENDMVNAAFTTDSKSLGLIASVGLMVYSNSESLQYVKDYGNATSEWEGFPITVNVPYSQILPGIQGPASSSAIVSMANSVVREKLGGFMVWCASVYDATRNKAAFNYGDDASKAKSMAWAQALKIMNP